MTDQVQPFTREELGAFSVVNGGRVGGGTVSTGLVDVPLRILRADDYDRLLATAQAGTEDRAQNEEEREVLRKYRAFSKEGQNVATFDRGVLLTYSEHGRLTDAAREAGTQTVPTPATREAGIIRGLRCQRAGNLCGTDTWGNGSECACVPCQMWLRQEQTVPQPTLRAPEVTDEDVRRTGVAHPGFTDDEFLLDFIEQAKGPGGLREDEVTRLRLIALRLRQIDYDRLRAARKGSTTPKSTPTGREDAK